MKLVEAQRKIELLITFAIANRADDNLKNLIQEVKTYNILGYGEVSIGGNKLLKRLTLTNIFPDNDTYFSLLASLVKQLN